LKQLVEARELARLQWQRQLQMPLKIAITSLFKQELELESLWRI
jgi:hypothetical protein